MSKNVNKNACPYCDKPLAGQAWEYQEHVAQCAVDQQNVKIEISVSTGEKAYEHTVYAKDIWLAQQKVTKYLEFIQADWDL